MSEISDRSRTVAPWPTWGPFGVTLLLMVFALYLVVHRALDGLAGAIIGSVTSYWLPSRRPEAGGAADG